MQSLTIPTQNPLTEGIINGWLEEKYTRTQSMRTVDAYRKAIESFRDFCVGRIIETSRDFGPALQRWSSVGASGEVLAPASINARIAAISSFFEYAYRNGRIDINPATLVPRKPVQSYRGATAISPEKIVEQLRQIDTSTLAGKRDYAILAVSLVTGKRLSEVASLRTDDIAVEGAAVRVIWRRTKGGKASADRLPVGVSWRLLDYMAAIEEVSEGVPPQHLWVALARNQYNMTPLGIKGMEMVTKRHVGTTKFHTLRHTFAKAMEQDGADVSEIQRRLMHSSLHTTGIYLQALRSDTNEHAASIESLFGIVPNKE